MAPDFLSRFWTTRFWLSNFLVNTIPWRTLSELGSFRGKLITPGLWFCQKKVHIRNNRAELWTGVWIANDSAVTIQQQISKESLDVLKLETCVWRRLMMKFDHIKSKETRKYISQLAKQHSIAGVIRPGKPGILYIEGLLQRIVRVEDCVRLN